MRTFLLRKLQRNWSSFSLSVRVNVVKPSLLCEFLLFLVNNKMVIKVPDHLKTSAPDRFQPLLLFSRFNERANLCIVSLLEHYLLRTVELLSKDSDLLFISFKSPHKPVGVQTISRWIRETLLDCGVDNSFTAHSTRHASTSF